jgi:hypothetical protein
MALLTTNALPQGALSVTEFFYGSGFTAKGIDMGLVGFQQSTDKGTLAYQ